MILKLILSFVSELKFILIETIK